MVLLECHQLTAIQQNHWISALNLVDHQS
jgi:hypothetical protein